MQRYIAGQKGYCCEKGKGRRERGDERRGEGEY
jgi:hypothetical protein